MLLSLSRLQPFPDVTFVNRRREEHSSISGHDERERGFVGRIFPNTYLHPHHLDDTDYGECEVIIMNRFHNLLKAFKCKILTVLVVIMVFSTTTF